MRFYKIIWTVKDRLDVNEPINLFKVRMVFFTTYTPHSAKNIVR
jgi:hypothetical protein